MTKEKLEIINSECGFDKKDGCYALACYSNKKCNSRDEYENPMYVPFMIIKKEERKYQK